MKGDDGVPTITFHLLDSLLDYDSFLGTSPRLSGIALGMPSVKGDDGTPTITFEIWGT